MQQLQYKEPEMEVKSEVIKRMENETFEEFVERVTVRINEVYKNSSIGMIPNFPSENYAVIMTVHVIGTPLYVNSSGGSVLQ